jgi:NitT/TauT family transport system substrate-binding protein
VTHLCRSRRGRVVGFVAPLVLAAVVLGACGSSKKATTVTAAPTTAGVATTAAATGTAASTGTGAASPSSASATTASSIAAGTTPASGALTSLTIGYSAWPGWFPLAVADKEGIFTKAGLKVDLKYFVDYTASLDALVAGQLDVNAQTLNDTIFAVASGSKQTIVVTGDNSTGNDAVICDKSITTIDGLKGKTVAAEAGVVDHFLLLQGLATKGMTESDIKFQGVKTDAAAAAFAGGQFDCAAVFAPFTLQALQRPGSHVLFSSKDFPGTIPDHLVATGKAVADPVAMQKLVNAWYMTLDYITANPDASTKIMADQAGLSVADYQSLATGTTLFTAQQALSAFADRPNDPTSLVEMARRINPFLVSSGLTKTPADLTGLFDASYTKAYVDRAAPAG